MNGIKTDLPLLSICIPTYNRCEYLRIALDNIIYSEGFGGDIEVIVSDNASTDNTFEMVNEYTHKFENIKYYRNNKNLEDENFYIALNHATGKYIRLFNDTLRFNPGKLAYMLDIVKKTNENDTLFFFQNIEFLNKNKEILFCSKTGCLKETSFFITWIANFGCWKEQYRKINEPCKYAWTKLLQVEWIFQLIKMNPKGIIYFQDFFISTCPINKGGYNLFNVFLNNYIYLLKKNIDASNNSFFRIEKEKYLLYRYFVLPWYNKLVLGSNQKSKFGLENVNKIIFSNYYIYPYYWIGIFMLYLKNVFKI